MFLETLTLFRTNSKVGKLKFTFPISNHNVFHSFHCTSVVLHSRQPLTPNSPTFTSTST